jgi:hypothetical protein
LSQQQDSPTIVNDVENLVDDSKNLSDGLTPKEELFLEVLFSEAQGDVQQAMELAGFNKTTSKQQLVSKLKEEILDAAKINLAGTSPLAIMGLINVLQDPTHPGAKNKLNAAKEILDRVGVVKEEKKTIDVNNRVMFILPAKEVAQPLVIDMEPND